MKQDKIQTNNRNIGLDILRIISMIMVLTLHYLGKGGLLERNNTSEIYNIIYWMLEALSIVAVNCFVLISGYFLCKSEFKLKKFLKLWGEVIFYSIIIYVIFVIIGIEKISISNLVRIIFPVITNQYWFVTSYLMLYLISPFLNKLINALNREEYKKLLIIILIPFCLLSILPTEMSLDKTGGYGIIWFVCLYFVAAYIRNYKTKFTKTRNYFLLYIAFSVVILVAIIGIQQICQILNISDKSEKMTAYNNPIVFLSSVSLFLTFLNLKVHDGILQKVIKFVAPLTFAVYIIHEHFAVNKVLYTNILHVEQCYNNNLGILICITSIFLVFLVCIAIEFLRRLVFDCVVKIWKKQKKQLNT